MNYGIVAKTKVYLRITEQGSQRRGLWCKPITTPCRGYDTISYNKRTRLMVSFHVVQNQSQCAPQRRTWAASTKRKKAGGGAMLDPIASVQPIIHGAVWGTREEKGTVFEIRWRVSGIESVPRGDQRSSRRSSCLETTWQGISIGVKEVASSNRERFQKVYTWRLAMDDKPC